MDTNQVKPEAREKVARFKQGMADIVWKVFEPTFVSLDIIEKLGQVGEKDDQVDEAYPRDLLE